MTDLIADPLNFEKKGMAAVHPSTRSSQVLPQNGSTTVTLQQSAQTQSTFYLPTRPLYFDKSSIRGVFNVDASGGATLTSNIYTNPGAFINSVRLLGNGTELVKIDNVAQYLNACSMYETPMDDFETNAPSGLSTTAALAHSVGSGPLLFPLTRPPQTTSLTVDQLAENSAGQGTKGQQRLRPPITSGAAFTNSQQNDRSYFLAGIKNAANVVPFEIPLSVFKNTLMASDKLMYLPNAQFQLEINWAPYANVGWVATDTNGSVAVLAAAPTISNIQLNIKIETNNEIVQAKVAQSSQGQELIIPYVNYRNWSNAGSGNVSQSIQIDSSMGNRLLHTMLVQHNNVLIHDLAFDINNLGATQQLVGSKCTQIQSAFDGLYLQEQPLNVSLNEDYEYNKHLFIDSCVTNSNIYQANRAWYDSFRSGACRDWDYFNSNQVVDGVDLMDRPKVWSYLATAAVASQWYFFIVTQRKMMISPQGQVVLGV